MWLILLYKNYTKFWGYFHLYGAQLLNNINHVGMGFRRTV